MQKSLYFGLCLLVLLLFFAESPIYAQSSFIVRTETGHRGGISSMAFSPDGKFLATSAYSDSTIKIWDGKTGGYVRTLSLPSGNTGYIRDYGNAHYQFIDFNNKQTTLAYVNADSIIYLVDYLTKKLLQEISVPKKSLVWVRLSITGDSIMSMTTSGDLYLLQTNTGILLHSWKIGLGNRGMQFDVNPSFSVITYTDTIDDLNIFDLQTNSIRYLFTTHLGYSLPRFQNNDSIIAAVDVYNDSLQFWNFKTGKHVKAAGFGKQIVDQFPSHIPNTECLVTTTSNNDTTSIFLYDLSSGLMTKNARTNLYRSFALSQDAHYFATGSNLEIPPALSSYTGNAELYDFDKGSLIKNITEVHGGAMASFSPKNDKYIINGSAGYLAIFETESGAPLIRLGTGGTYESETLDGGVFSFDGRYVAFSSIPSFEQQGNNYLYIYDADSNRTAGALLTYWQVSSDFASSPVESLFLHLASQSYTSAQEALNSFRADGKKLFDSSFVQPEGKANILSYRFSFDGKLVAVTLGDSLGRRLPTISVYNFPSGSLSSMFQTSFSVPKTIEYSRSGRTLATIEKDTIMAFYDSSGLLLKAISLPSIANALRYSSNNKYLLVGCSDSTVRVYDLNSGRFVFNYDSLEGSISGIDISNDGKYILAATDNGFVYLLKAIPQLGVHQDAYLSQNQGSIAAFPNPAAEKIDLEFFPENLVRILSVFDAVGREVLRHSIASQQHSLGMQIKTLPEGIYYIRLGDQRGKFVVAK